MNDDPAPRLAKWPFFLGDLFMAGVAVAVLTYSQRPLGLWSAVVCSASAGLGAWLAIIPFLAEYRGALKLRDSGNLVDAVRQVSRIEEVAAQMAGATGQWQGIHEHAGKAIEAAREISGKMTAETTEFRAFLQKSNDVEKAHLRLEVEKLRRGEGEWMQILVRQLDNTFALFQAALRSEQPPLIEQISQFQKVSRDVARRVGLVAFAPNPTDLFDATLHEPADAKQELPEGARVAQVLATGYTLQGQLVRKSLVSIAAIPEEPVIAVAQQNGAEHASSLDGAEPGQLSPPLETESVEADAGLHGAAAAETESPTPAREEENQESAGGSAPDHSQHEAANGPVAGEGQPLLF